MSVVERRSETEALPRPDVSSTTNGQPIDARRPRLGRDRTPWAAVPAVAVAFASTLAFVDLASAVAGAASIGALAYISTRIRSWNAPDTAARRALLVGTGSMAGAIAAAGVVVADGSGTTVTLAAQLAMVWFAALRISTVALPHSVDFDDSAVRVVRSAVARGRVCTSAALAVAVVALTAMLVSDLTRAAVVLSFALPIAFGLFWAANSDDGLGHPTWKPLVRATLTGITAAAFVTADLAGVASDVTKVGLAVIALVAGGAGWFARRAPERIDAVLRVTNDRLGLLGFAGLALVTGIAVGAPPAVALMVALVATVVNRSSRPAPASAPSVPRSALIVATLTVGGFVMRLFTGRGLWLDETTSVFQARKPLVDMVRFIYETDNHPPLHHLVLWADIRLVGDSELALRLPMMLMGAALIPMVYLIGRELFDRRVGVYAAAITTFAPITVWYGQEARMYSQFMLLAAISVYALVRILRTGSNRYWMVFTLSSVALVYTQYFAVLHVIGTLVVLLVECFRRRSRGEAHTLLPGMVKTIAVQALLIAPLVPFALTQAARNQDEGFGLTASGITGGSAVVPPPGIYGFLTNIQWVFFGYLPDDVSIRLVALWPIGMLLLLLVLGTPRRTSNRILLTIAGVPMLVVFAASFLADESRSLAEVRYFSGAVPMLFILFVAGVVAIVRTRGLQYAVIGTTIALMSVALLVQQVDSENPRLYEYREAIEQIREVAEPGDRVVFAPQYLNYTFDYYDPTIPDAALEDGLPTTNEQSIFVVEGASFADSAEADLEVDQAIADLVDRGMEVDTMYTFAQITVWKIGPGS